MAALSQPSVARIRTCSINGVDLKWMVRKISVRESVCTAYLSGEIDLLDMDNIIDGLKLIGGDPIHFSFDAPPNSRTYDQNVYVLSIEGEVSPDNLKAMRYTIAFVSSEYFSDRANMVEKSVRGMTGVALAQQIWGEIFGTSLSTPVSDKPLSDGNEPFQIQHQKPFTALAQIRDRMVYPAYLTGNTLLFRDRDKEVMAPLEYLFTTMSSQETFIQKETWGAHWRDTFEADNAIIDAKAQTRSEGGGRAGMQGVSSAASQGKRVFDIVAGKLVNNMIFGQAISSFAGSISSMVQGGGGGSKLGGSYNIQQQNTDRQSQGNDYTEKTEAERLYAANMKAGPQYNIRVPLQTGINVTVGNGATFNLLPPYGDGFTAYKRNAASGLHFITDLIHEVYGDMRLVQGTTTFQTMKGSLSY